MDISGNVLAIPAASYYIHITKLREWTCYTLRGRTFTKSKKPHLYAKKRSGHIIHANSIAFQEQIP